MAKVSFIMTLLIFHGCLFCHDSATTTYITSSPTTTAGEEGTTSAAVATTSIVSSDVVNATPGGDGVSSTTAGGGEVTTTADGGGVSSTTAGGEVTTTVASEGNVIATSTTTGGVTTSAVFGDGVTTTGVVGGGVTTTGDAAGGVTTSAVSGDGVATTGVVGRGVTTTAGEETATSVTSSAVVVSEGTNTAVTGGDVSTTGGAVTSTASVSVIATTTTGIGATTSTAGGGETSSAVDGGEVSPTTTQTAPPPSSVYVDNRPGPEVSLTVTVTTDCSDSKLASLNQTMTNGILIIYKGTPYRLKGVKATSVTCISQFKGIYTLLFYRVGSSSGSTIEGVFKVRLEQGDFGNSITASNTVYTFEFQGVDIKRTPKSGECGRVCCDGAGGELLIELTCSPPQNCTGVDVSVRKEKGYCPGESKAYCECSNGSQDLPSFALITVLGLASLMKSIFLL